MGPVPWLQVGRPDPGPLGSGLCGLLQMNFCEPHRRVPQKFLKVNCCLWSFYANFTSTQFSEVRYPLATPKQQQKYDVWRMCPFLMSVYAALVTSEGQDFTFTPSPERRKRRKP
jgi:hypothetical protein